MLEGTVRSFRTARFALLNHDVQDISMVDAWDLGYNGEGVHIQFVRGRTAPVRAPQLTRVNLG